MLVATRIQSLRLILLVAFFVASALAQSTVRDAELQSLSRLLDDRPEELIARLETIVQEEPSVSSYLLMAQAWARIDANRSVGWLEKLFQLSPQHQEAWKFWADIMVAGEQYDFAILRLEQQVRQNPSAYLHLLLAQIHVTTDSLSKAEMEFQKAFEVASASEDNQIRALYSLGYLKLIVGDVQKGEHLLRQVLDRNSSYVPALIDLSSLLLDIGQVKEAGRLLTRALQIESDNPEIILLWGRYHLGEGKWNEALQILGKLLDKYPDNSQGHFFLGQAFQRSGMPEKAGQHFHTFQELKKKSRDRQRLRSHGLAAKEVR